MKKYILSMILIFLIAGANAQIKWGLQGGFNFSSAKFEYGSDFTEDFNPKLGFEFGVVSEMPIFSSIAFRPEINLMSTYSKHAHSSDWFFYYSENHRIRLTYVNVPLNFVYNIPLASSQSAFFGFGPSLALGLSGDYKYETQIDGDKESSSATVKFDGRDIDDEYLHLKPMNFGVSFSGGYRFAEGIFVNVSYIAGVSNISPYDGISIKTNSMELKVGYMFDSKPAKKK